MSVRDSIQMWRASIDIVVYWWRFTTFRCRCHSFPRDSLSFEINPTGYFWIRLLRLVNVSLVRSKDSVCETQIDEPSELWSKDDTNRTARLLVHILIFMADWETSACLVGCTETSTFTRFRQTHLLWISIAYRKLIVEGKINFMWFHGMEMGQRMTTIATIFATVIGTYSLLILHFIEWSALDYYSRNLIQSNRSLSPEYSNNHEWILIHTMTESRQWSTFINAFWTSLLQLSIRVYAKCICYWNYSKFLRHSQIRLFIDDSLLKYYPFESISIA